MLDKLLTVFGNHGKADPLARPRYLDRGAIGQACYAMDPNGRGRAIWENNGKIWTTLLGFGGADSMANHALGPGRAPGIALNSGGSGIAVWIVEGSAGRTLSGLPLGRGKSQDAPSAIFTTSGAIRHIRIRVDRRGGAVLVWSHEQGGEFETLAAHYNGRAGAWDDEPTRLGPRVRHPVEPQLAMNSRGQAVVAWTEERKDARDLLACLSGPGPRPWPGPPALLASGRLLEHQVAIDPAGNALGLFLQQDSGAPAALKARRYAVAASAWQEPEVLGSALHLRQIRLATNAAGDTLAVWLQGGGLDPAYLRSMAFRGGRWGDRETYLTAKGSKIEDFSVALGPGGLAALLCLARQEEGYLPVMRDLGSRGKEVLPVAEASGDVLDQPLMGLCAKGTIALWRMGEGSRARLVCARQSRSGA